MVNVEICMGSHCSLLGALNILENIEELKKDYPNQIKIKKVECMDKCDDIKNAPLVRVDDCLISSAQTQQVSSKVMERIK